MILKMPPGALTRCAVQALDSMAHALLPAPNKPKPEHSQTGQRGEEDAYFHLRKLGYTMVARNWRSSRRRGEIDLIGWEDDVLCFIEVKTRTTRAVKPAEAAVDNAKQDELRGMAHDYLRRMKLLPAMRFDVVSVYFQDPAGAQPTQFQDHAGRQPAILEAERKPQAASPDITLFKNAFTMS